jgi:hypothetical protein
MILEEEGCVTQGCLHNPLPQDIVISLTNSFFAPDRLEPFKPSQLLPSCHLILGQLC